MKPSDAFIEKLTELSDTAHELLALWKLEDDTGTMYLAEYPFDKNFEEMVNEIDGWLEQMEE